MLWFHEIERSPDVGMFKTMFEHLKCHFCLKLENHIVAMFVYSNRSAHTTRPHNPSKTIQETPVIMAVKDEDKDSGLCL
jgi:hypothetical protein